MSRVPYVNRESIAQEHQDIYDRIASTRGSVQNVFAALLNSPEAAEGVTNLGEYLRYRCPLDPAVREMTILAVAREAGSRYEWAQHEPVAREVGVREEVIEAIRSGRAPMGLPPKEGVFTQGAKEVVRDGRVSAKTYAALDHLLGTRKTVDYLVLCGYYNLVATLIASLDVDFDDWLSEETGF